MICPAHCICQISYQSPNFLFLADQIRIFKNLFFARVDSYARNTALAPAPNGIKLTLGKDAEQNIMRLASAAAEKDLSDFFQRWGMVMDADTKAYMQQFEKEARAIYYVNDEARAYEMLPLHLFQRMIAPA